MVLHGDSGKNGIVTRETVKRIARECGFELAGIAPAETSPEFSDDFARYQAWNAQGHTAPLTDRPPQAIGAFPICMEPSSLLARGEHREPARPRVSAGEPDRFYERAF